MGLKTLTGGRMLGPPGEGVGRPTSRGAEALLVAPHKVLGACWQSSALLSGAIAHLLGSSSCKYWWGHFLWRLVCPSLAVV